MQILSMDIFSSFKTDPEDSVTLSLKVSPALEYFFIQGVHNGHWQLFAPRCTTEDSLTPGENLDKSSSHASYFYFFTNCSVLKSASI